MGQRHMELLQGTETHGISAWNRDMISLHGTETYGFVAWDRDIWICCMEQRHVELLH